MFVILTSYIFINCLELQSFYDNQQEGDTLCQSTLLSRRALAFQTSLTKKTDIHLLPLKLVIK